MDKKTDKVNTCANLRGFFLNAYLRTFVASYHMYLRTYLRTFNELITILHARMSMKTKNQMMKS